LGIDARGQKTRVMGLPGRKRSLTILSAVRILSTNVTDKWTDTGPQQRLHLCIALCHKNCSTFAKAIVFILDFIGAKGDAGGSNNWSFKTCIAPMKSLSNQQCQSTEGTKHHTPWTCSPQAHLGVLHPCHYHY